MELSDTKKSLPLLQMKLITYKMQSGEGVQGYYNIIEQYFHDSIDATMEGGGYSNSHDIGKLLHN